MELSPRSHRISAGLLMEDILGELRHILGLLIVFTYTTHNRLLKCVQKLRLARQIRPLFFLIILFWLNNEEKKEYFKENFFLFKLS